MPGWCNNKIGRTDSCELEKEKRMKVKENGDKCLFAIKELAISKNKDGDFNLNIKVPEDFVKYFIKNRKQKETKNTDFPIVLTKREKEVLKKLSMGKNNNEIAKELMVSTHTVKSHVAKIFEKLEVKDRVQAAVKAATENII